MAPAVKPFGGWGFQDLNGMSDIPCFACLLHFLDEFLSVPQLFGHFILDIIIVLDLSTLHLDLFLVLDHLTEVSE